VKNELDAALVRDFPNLYRMRNASMRETCMCWGFECGDGWEPLIRRLSEKLEAMILAMPEEERADYRCEQVKEKYGTLAYFIDVGTDEMHEAIGAACEESAVTCEACGAPGKERGGGWIQTLCDACHKP
jgi:hypothetical protein